MKCAVPDGFVIVRKGGRPKAIAKHVGIYMARLHYTEVFGKAYLADARLMNLFGLSDDSVIRRMVGKAEKYVAGFEVSRHPDFPEALTLWRAVPNRWTPRKSVVPDGVDAWFWVEGARVAMPGKISSLRWSTSLTT